MNERREREEIEKHDYGGEDEKVEQWQWLHSIVATSIVLSRDEGATYSSKKEKKKKEPRLQKKWPSNY